MQAAALGFSLIQGHAFVDGNKRIGHAALEVFLVLNGCELCESVDEQEREAQPEKRVLFTRKDFQYDEERSVCICPAGHKMYSSGRNMLFNGYRASHFRAPLTACRGCPLRAKCLRHPERTPQRQLLIIKSRESAQPLRSRKGGAGAVERMRWRFDTPMGRELYSRRMGTVEPVFANLQNKGMRRFTLRTRRKVDVQWRLFTMVHNIEKIAGGGGHLN